MKLATAARTHLPIAVGAGALVLGGVLASAGSADAADHGSQIRNYPLKQRDIGKAGVSGTRQGQDEIAHQSIGQVDIGQNGVSGSAGGSAGEIAKGTIGQNDLSDGLQGKLGGGDTPKYETFTSTQDFSPGGIGGVWCGAPAQGGNGGWTPLSGGAKLTTADIDAGVVVASSWQNTSDPDNPGWSFQVNKPANVNPGDVTMTVVCVK